jgi:hypothetical protein
VEEAAAVETVEALTAAGIIVATANEAATGRSRKPRPQSRPRRSRWRRRESCVTYPRS